MRIVIVDDELLIAEMLKEMIQDLNYEIIGIAKNYIQALNILEENKGNIDLIFLDINLNEEKSGFDIAEIIKEKYHIPFYFLTSYSDKKTIDTALEYLPNGYLIKPFEEVDIYTTIELFKTKKNIQSLPTNKTILIKDGTKSIKIDQNDILYIKSDNIYIEIFTREKKYLVRNSLSKFLEESNFNKIIRVHRTYAVNVDYINGVNGEYVFVHSEKIPFSRNHRDEIFTRFKQ